MSVKVQVVYWRVASTRNFFAVRPSAVQHKFVIPVTAVKIIFYTI